MTHGISLRIEALLADLSENFGDGNYKDILEGLKEHAFSSGSLLLPVWESTLRNIPANEHSCRIKARKLHLQVAGLHRRMLS